MDYEIINRIEINTSDELFLGLEGNGKTIYQYTYRDASGVYWDEKNHGFKSTKLKEWSCSKWFSHIINVVKSALDVELQVSKKATWSNIPEQEKEIIENEHASI